MILQKINFNHFFSRSHYYKRFFFFTFLFLPGFLYLFAREMNVLGNEILIKGHDIYLEATLSMVAQEKINMEKIRWDCFYFWKKVFIIIVLDHSYARWKKKSEKHIFKMLKKNYLKSLTRFSNEHMKIFFKLIYLSFILLKWL